MELTLLLSHIVGQNYIKKGTAKRRVVHFCVIGKVLRLLSKASEALLNTAANTLPAGVGEKSVTFRTLLIILVVMPITGLATGDNHD
jgi:hypothetical protein